jgi:hypothetical protein
MPFACSQTPAPISLHLASLMFLVDDQVLIFTFAGCEEAAAQFLESHLQASLISGSHGRCN